MLVLSSPLALRAATGIPRSARYISPFKDDCKEGDQKQPYARPSMRIPAFRMAADMLSFSCPMDRPTCSARTGGVGEATLTIRLSDDKHARLGQMAQQRKISLNKLMEELATIALTQFDAETWFLARAARGSAAEGIRLLDKLDAADEASGS